MELPDEILMMNERFELARNLQARRGAIKRAVILRRKVVDAYKKQIMELQEQLHNVRLNNNNSNNNNKDQQLFEEATSVTTTAVTVSTNNTDEGVIIQEDESEASIQHAKNILELHENSELKKQREHIYKLQKIIKKQDSQQTQQVSHSFNGH